MRYEVKFESVIVDDAEDEEEAEKIAIQQMENHF